LQKEKRFAPVSAEHPELGLTAINWALFLARFGTNQSRQTLLHRCGTSAAPGK